MANHVKIFRRGGDITMEEVLEVYEKVNKERFDGNLHHEFHHEGKTLSILPDKSGYEALVIDIPEEFIDYLLNKETGDYDIPNVIAGKHIDMRHGHGNDFYWWLDGQFVKAFAESLSADIFDEGTGFNKAKDYNNISFQNYIKRKCTSIKDNKLRKDWYDNKMKELEYLEENLGSKFYHMFVTEKTPTRINGIDSILND